MVLTICHFRCHNIMATILRLITILVIHILVFLGFFERLRCETWSFFCVIIFTMQTHHSFGELSHHLISMRLI